MENRSLSYYCRTLERENPLLPGDGKEFEKKPNRKIFWMASSATLFFEPSTRNDSVLKPQQTDLGARVIGFTDS